MPNKSLQAKAWKPSVRRIWYVHLFCTPLTGKHASIHTCLRTHLVPCIKSFSLNNRAEERKGQIVAEPSIKTSGAWHLPPRPGLDEPGCPPALLTAYKKSQSQEIHLSLSLSYSYYAVCQKPIYKAFTGLIYMCGQDNKCQAAFTCMEKFKTENRDWREVRQRKSTE